MSLKAVATLALMVVGVGQAEAATVSPPFGTYKVKLEFFNADVYCFFECSDDEKQPTAYGGMTVGETRTGTLVVNQSGPDGILLDIFWSGGVIANSYELIHTEGNSYYSTMYYYFDYDIKDGVYSGSFSAAWNRGLNSDIEQMNDFKFTEIAPVPLPATAALLPVGIGALAMMRKRRKA